MWKKLISKITHNLPLKLASVLIAIVLWYVAIYYSDPKETRAYTVHVDVINETYIASGKQVYYIDDTYKTVTVYVTDNTSKLNTITENYISVTADLTQIIDFNRDPVMVPLSVSCAGVSASNLSLSRDAIPITIENVASKELPITVSTAETTPNKNYEIGALTPSVSSITVNGPESIISKIDSVVAVINVSNMTVSSERKATLSFIDKDQNTISQNLINDDVTIAGDLEEVSVYVELWRKRAGIKFEVNYNGSPAENYRVNQITTSPDEITVAGNPDALELLESEGNVIRIPADRIDISGKSDDVTLDVEISDLLPNNMKVASSMNTYVSVTVSILPVDSKEFDFDVDEIRINNLGSNYSVSYASTTVPVKVRASTENLSKLKASDISASIDLKGLTAGETVVPVSVELPNGYELVDDLTITITIKEKTKESATETNATNTTTTVTPNP